MRSFAARRRYGLTQLVIHSELPRLGDGRRFDNLLLRRFAEENRMSVKSGHRIIICLLGFLGPVADWLSGIAVLTASEVSL